MDDRYHLLKVSHLICKMAVHIQSYHLLQHEMAHIFLVNPLLKFCTEQGMLVGDNLFNHLREWCILDIHCSFHLLRFFLQPHKLMPRRFFSPSSIPYMKGSSLHNIQLHLLVGLGHTIQDTVSNYHLLVDKILERTLVSSRFFSQEKELKRIHIFHTCQIYEPFHWEDIMGMYIELDLVSLGSYSLDNPCKNHHSKYTYLVDNSEYHSSFCLLMVFSSYHTLDIHQ